MKKWMTALLIASTCSPALAGDSSWYLCSGYANVFGSARKMAVNVFEHRAGDKGDKRATDLTLIFGGYLLRGSFDSTEKNSAEVSLVQPNSFFNGRASFDPMLRRISLDGTLSLQNDKAAPLDGTMSCESMSDI